MYVFRRDSSRFNPSPVIISTHIFGQEHNVRKQLNTFSFASRTRKTLRLRLACQLHDIHVGPLHSLLFRSLLPRLGGADVMFSTSVRADLRGRYDSSSKGEGVGHKIGLDSLQWRRLLSRVEIHTRLKSILKDLLEPGIFTRCFFF